MSAFEKKQVKENWIGHILRKHGLPKHVTEGKIEGTKHEEEEHVSSYWMNFRTAENAGKKEALDRTVRRIGFGRGCGLIVMMMMMMIRNDGSSVGIVTRL